jgi:two-component system sensor histidine kinase BaeS
MRTKIFIAFLLVISLALFSNLLFEKLIIKDFDDYVKGTREDHLYWLLAAIESSYSPGPTVNPSVKGNISASGGWDRGALVNSLHWAMMLRFDIVVKDVNGKLLLDSREVMGHLSESMKRKMQEIGPPETDISKSERYPLFSGGQEIGTLYARDITKDDSPLMVKGLIFKHRGQAFLIISFLIAGGGALFLALLFSQFLSKPVRELKTAAERVGKGDLSVRLSTGADEIGRLKAAFNKMAEALQREDSLRKRLMSNVAHELRTPLAVMKARIEAMLDGIIGTDKPDLEGLKAEMDHLARLIAGIEDLTKAEATFFKKNEPEKVSLHEFLSGIKEGFTPLFTERGLSLELAGDGDLAVLTEPEKLEKVLRNIITNALAHTKKGGVVIDYGKEKSREGFFFISVQDTGRGISAEDLPNIFNRFHKGKSSNGLGLGLAISRELIEIMGGTIEARSEPGKGALFTLRLPRGQEPKGSLLNGIGIVHRSQ